jgi:D-alanyl-lipoteichoic acid acyltransferase DltB (MBOAT superfamily)
MLFNSISFLLFFPVVCALYFAIPASRVRIRNGLLLVASYYFYMNWEPAYALLLMASTIVTWGAAIAMDWRAAGNRYRRWWVVVSIMLNLAVLALFKYYSFLTDSLSEALQMTGLSIRFQRWLRSACRAKPLTENMCGRASGR